MTRDDITRIEFELGIELPEQYRQAVVPYPVPALRGNTEWMFWNDPNELIALNKRMREGERFREAWPPRFFALGEDGGGCSDAIDLEDPEYGVFWFDRQHINVSNSDRSDEKIDAWVKRQISDSKHDLEADGIDPQGTPEETRAIREENSKGGFIPLLIVAIVGGVIVSAIIIGWKLLTGS